MSKGVGRGERGEGSGRGKGKGERGERGRGSLIDHLNLLTYAVFIRKAYLSSYGCEVVRFTEGSIVIVNIIILNYNSFMHTHMQTHT